MRAPAGAAIDPARLSHASQGGAVADEIISVQGAHLLIHQDLFIYS